MKKVVSIILAVVVAIVGIVTISFGIYNHRNKADNTETLKASEKTITLTISADDEEKSFTIKTDEKTLGKALVKSGYVEDNQSEYGLYIQTVFGLDKEGRTADDSKQEWWCITKGGESVMTGADSVEIADGDKYELTLKVGY